MQACAQRVNFTRILRTTAWIWLGFLLAMALMDFALYTPQVQQLLGDGVRVQQLPNQPLPQTPGAPRKPAAGLSFFIRQMAEPLCSFCCSAIGKNFKPL